METKRGYARSRNDLSTLASPISISICNERKKIDESGCCRYRYCCCCCISTQVKLVRLSMNWTKHSSGYDAIFFWHEDRSLSLSCYRAAWVQGCLETSRRCRRRTSINLKDSFDRPIHKYNSFGARISFPHVTIANLVCQDTRWVSSVFSRRHFTILSYASDGMWSSIKTPR